MAGATLGLDACDFVLSETLAEQQRLVVQTPSLGLKQNVVRWLPGGGGGTPVALSGSWDDEANELALWSVELAGSAMDDGTGIQSAAKRLCGAAHAGDVLGLEFGGGVGGQPLVAFTASGAGGVSCFSVDVHPDGAAEILPLWERRSAPASGLATLGIGYRADAGGVAAVGEDGAVAVLRPDNGEAVWRAQSGEPALMDACWWDAHTVVTAGTSLGLWDVRAKAGAAPALALAPAASQGRAAHMSAQLTCIAVEKHPPCRLAAGASDGAVPLWDVRAAAAAGRPHGAAPPTHSWTAHAEDVWDVQFCAESSSLCSASAGQLLFSCGSDCSLQAWELGGAVGVGGAAPKPAETPPFGTGGALMEHDGRARTDAPPSRSLVELPLPINSLDASEQYGMLASASDAQVLTFIDMR